MEPVPEGDALEQQQDVLPEPEGALSQDIETPEADAIEQHEEVVVATGFDRPSSDIEVDDADRLEQAQIVATDDEDEVR